MSTTNVPVTKVLRTGVQILTSGATAADGSNGNSFTNDGNCLAILEVAGAATNVVATFATAATHDGYAIADQTVSLAANDRQIVGPFPPALFNNMGATDPGKVTVTWTGTLTNATIQIVQI